MEEKKESSLAYRSRRMRELNERLERGKEEHRIKLLKENGQPIPPPDTRSWEEKIYVEVDKYGTIDNATATIWYIIIMAIGLVFNSRWLIWIIATAVYYKHINRKAIRQREWDEKHKNGGNKQ